MPPSSAHSSRYSGDLLLERGAPLWSESFRGQALVVETIPTRGRHRARARALQSSDGERAEEDDMLSDDEALRLKAVTSLDGSGK